MSDDFEQHRRYLRGVAYRMLGSVAEAEDAVQDAFLRWHGVDHATVDEPRGYLTRIVTRLCLDRLKSARAQREQYVGTWLPEPVVSDAVAEDLSVALLMTLERLSPLERAAFLLHDVFDVDYAEVAATLDRTEDACRQLAARARSHVRARPRFTPSADDSSRLSAAFQAALLSGDLAALETMLAADAVLYTDGGGKKLAALQPIYGRDKIVRFFAGVATKHAPITPDMVSTALLNGLPALIVRSPDGLETLAIEIADGAIAAIYAVRNPDKLRHLELS